MSDEPAFFVGETFQCYEDFQAKLNQYEKVTGNKVYKRDCRTIDAAKKRATRKHFNPALVYAALHYCCVHGGRYRSRSTGARPYQKSLKLGCPMELKLATTSDGQELLVTGFIKDHLHLDAMPAPESAYSDEIDMDDVKSEGEAQDILLATMDSSPIYEARDESVSFVHKTKTARKAIPRKVIIRESSNRTENISPPEPSTDIPALGFIDDEESLFGRLVAGRLRKITDDMVRESTKLKILSIIFQAEFGAYPELAQKEQDDMILSSTVVVCNEEK